MPERVIILGASGMLGAMLADRLARDTGLAVTATVRNEALAQKGRRQLPEATWALFDAGAPHFEAGLKAVSEHDWVINAIGITKPLVHDDNAAEVERAIGINSLLPFLLAEQAKTSGTRILQIATDCVYSGRQGAYRESDPHDPLDVYGKTKSLGEVPAEHVRHLRCSIIGPEPKDRKFLLEWFLGQEPGGGVNGFTNHRWNGVTTLAFARLCKTIIKNDIALPRVLHVIPGDDVSKHELLQIFAGAYGRADINITPMAAPKIVDRTLETEHEDTNRTLWAAAEYESPPSVAQMVEEMAGYQRQLVEM
ncbi:sugar nucleotide-binding protein [Chloroflexota bacterium]